MNKTEARDCIGQININVTKSGVLLQQLHDREGWKALGYATFHDCVKKEFPDLAGGRSQIYRLMHQAAVEANVGEPVPISVAEQVSKLPASEQKAAVAEIKQVAGNDRPVVQTAKTVVENRVKSAPAAAPKKAAKKKKATTGGDYLKALDRIGAIIGSKERKAIESGALSNVTEKEAILWAKQKDAVMDNMRELVVTKRWKPSAALKALTKMVDENTRIKELINLAIAGSGEWSGDFSGFTVTVKEKRRRR